MSLPKDAKKMDMPDSTVDFFEYEKDGITYYYFDTSLSVPPEPMINAMLGLRLLDNDKKRLIMINHKPPMGLFPKIEDNFDYRITPQEDNVRIEFWFITGTKPATNFDDNKCSG